MSTSKKEKRFSKVGILIVACMLLSLLFCLGVAFMGGFSFDKQDLNDDDSPKVSDLVGDNSPIMIFDKRSETRALLAAYEDNAIDSVSSGGASSDDETVVLNSYRALKNIVISEEISEPSNGTQLNVTFTLTDGTECGFEFITGDEEAACIDGVWYKAKGVAELADAVAAITE